MIDDPIELLRNLVHTPTGPDLSIEEKLDRTRFVRDILDEFGFDVETRNGCHIARRGNPPYTTFIGHLDTVFPEGEERRRPFRIEGGIAYGPGVADMKGGVVVMLEALKRLRMDGVDGIDGMAVIMNVDEEMGSFESEKIFDEFSKMTKYCLSFEPAFPDGKLVSARKGVGKLRILCHGRKGHAARLGEGANAIVELSEKIVRLWNLNTKFEHLTLNPTLMRGGIKSNVTPDSAEVSFDMRYYDEREIESLKDEIELILKNPFVAGTRLEYFIEPFRKPMKRCEELVKIVEDLGYSTGMSPGAGDSAFFDRALDGLGLPGGFFHSEKEYAIISKLEEKVRLAVEIVNRIGRSNKGR